MNEPSISPAWAREAVFYHVYPLGLCGAPTRNDFDAPAIDRLGRLFDWIGHLRDLGVNALYLGPLFESTAHGYDTADYRQVDRRLGTNELLARLVEDLHSGGIRVILDGVFHHVGRDFWAFRDVQQHGEQSPYCDWFAGLDFGHRSPHGDPFTYEAWHGHYDLVKLNLQHPDVRAHLFEAVTMWFETFHIDGLRLDVAEDIDMGFLQDLAAHVHSLRPDAYLLGEVIHGDYSRWANPSTLDATTNYECYKGLYSSHNDRNYFEIAHSLDRQFGEGGLYRGLPLYNFVDNHDVDRVASALQNPEHLVPLYLLLFMIPGVPSIYAGSEWGFEGEKTDGDDRPLRPSIESPAAGRDAGPHPQLADAIAQLASLRRDAPALQHGTYHELHVDHQQLAFARQHDDTLVVVVVNAADEQVALEIVVDAPEGSTFVDLLKPDGTSVVSDGRLAVDVPAYGGRVLAWGAE